jgi:hypothetical protein
VSTGQQAANKVALENVLKNPQDYDGKTIEVSGYLLQAFENSALYPNEHWQRTKGIWVTPTVAMAQQRDKANRCFVLLTGVFNSKNHGHLGQFKGTLTVQSFQLSGSPDKVSK